MDSTLTHKVYAFRLLEAHGIIRFRTEIQSIGIYRCFGSFCPSRVKCLRRTKIVGFQDSKLMWSETFWPNCPTCSVQRRLENLNLCRVLGIFWPRVQMIFDMVSLLWPILLRWLGYTFLLTRFRLNHYIFLVLSFLLCFEILSGSGSG